jgi:hypothetical protein
MNILPDPSGALFHENLEIKECRVTIRGNHFTMNNDRIELEQTGVG